MFPTRMSPLNKLPKDLSAGQQEKNQGSLAFHSACLLQREENPLLRKRGIAGRGRRRREGRGEEGVGGGGENEGK